MMSGQDATQKVHLICGKRFNLLHEKLLLTIEQVLNTLFEMFICHTLSFVNEREDEPRQLLHIRRIVIYQLTDFSSLFRRYRSLPILKMLHDVFHPCLCRNLVKKLKVTKLIERHVSFLKHIHHGMLLASEKAIRGKSLMLPYGTQPFLYAYTISHLSYLLEFIYTNHDSLLFLLGYFLCKAQYLFRCMRLWTDT